VDSSSVRPCDFDIARLRVVWSKSPIIVLEVRYELSVLFLLFYFLGLPTSSAEREFLDGFVVPSRPPCS
jgi:hypothetical protein